MPELLIKVIGALVVGVPVVAALFWQLLKYLFGKVEASYEKRWQNIEASLADQSDDIAALEREMRSLHERAGLLDNRVTTAERGHGQHEGRMKELENDMDQVEREAMQGRDKILARLEATTERMITRDQLAGFNESLRMLNNSMLTLSKRIDDVYSK